jgi:tetratricopeptide (TPR) repeat protein
MAKSAMENRERLFVKALQGREQVYNLTGEYEKELLDCKRAVSFCKTATYCRSMEPRAMLNLGNALRWNRYHEDAKKILTQALKRIDRKREQQVYARCLNLLGMLHDDLGDAGKTLRYYRESLEVNKCIRNKNGIASCANNIGLHHWSRGNLEKALGFFKESLGFWKETQNREGIGVASGNLGLAYFSMGQLNKALECFLANLEVSQEINHKIRIVIALGNAGEVFKEKGDLDQALNFFQKALELATEMGNKYEIAFAHLYLGATYCEKASLKEARKYLESAKRSFMEMNHKVNLATVYMLLARIHREENDAKRSLEFGRKALSLSIQTGAKEQQIGALRELARTMAGHNSAKAIHYLEKSVSIAKEENMNLELAKSYFELATVQKAAGKAVDGKIFMDKAQRIFEKADAQLWLKKADSAKP